MLAIFLSITLPHHTPCKGSIISLHLMKSMESYIMIRMHTLCSLTTCTFLARDLSHPSAKEPSMHALIPCCPDGLCDVYWHRSMAKSKWCGDTHKWAVSSYVIEERRQSPHIVIFHHDTNHKNIFPWIKAFTWRTKPLVRVCEPVKNRSSQLNLPAYTQVTKTTKQQKQVRSPSSLILSLASIIRVNNLKFSKIYMFFFFCLGRKFDTSNMNVTLHMAANPPCTKLTYWTLWRHLYIKS